MAIHLTIVLHITPLAYVLSCEKFSEQEKKRKTNLDPGEGETWRRRLDCDLEAGAAPLATVTRRPRWRHDATAMPPGDLAHAGGIPTQRRRDGHRDNPGQGDVHDPATWRWPRRGRPSGGGRRRCLHATATRQLACPLKLLFCCTLKSLVFLL